MSFPRLRRFIALLLSAAVLTAAPGLAPYEALAQVVGRAAPVGVPAVPGAAGLAPAVAASGISPSLNLVLPAPSLRPLTLPSPVVGRGADVGLRAEPAAAAAAAVLASPSSSIGRTSTPDIGLRAPVAAANPRAHALPLGPSGEAGEKEVAPAALSMLQTAGREAAPSRPGAARAPDAAFAALFDGSAARPALNAAVEPAERAAQPAGRPAKPPKRRGVGLVLKRATAVGALVVGLRMAAPNIPGLPADTSLWTRALDVVGRGGYWLGNLMAFAFAVPQIYKTYRDGSAGKTPVWRAVVGASASLALGLVSAPLAKQMFWGVQNIFGGLALAAPLLIGAYLARKGLRFSARKAAALTAATAALLFAPAFAMYAAAAELVPSAIDAAVGAAGAGHIALGLQIATGAAFFLLFVPDIIAIMKGRAPKGFTSMFSMLFALASVGFIAWTLQMAAAAPAGSSERVQFLIYAAQNAAYAVVSLLSWFYIRRAERKTRPNQSGIR